MNNHILRVTENILCYNNETCVIMNKLTNLEICLFQIESETYYVLDIKSVVKVI